MLVRKFVREYNLAPFDSLDASMASASGRRLHTERTNLCEWVDNNDAPNIGTIKPKHTSATEHIRRRALKKTI